MSGDPSASSAWFVIRTPKRMGAKPSSFQGGGILATALNEIKACERDKLALHSCGVTERDVKEFALLLKHDRTVKELRLKNCYLNHIGTKYLANVLNDTCITKLYLSCNMAIRDRGALALASVMPFSNLIELSLDTTSLTDRAASGIASVLDRSQLEVLYLGGNEITDHGAATLAAALPKSSIKRLYLSSCKVRDSGAKCLAEAMKFTPLTVLTLSFNFVTDVGARALANATKQCQTLQKLDLSCNDVSDESVDQFLEILGKHASIRMICFQSTPVSVQKIEMLEAELAKLHTEKARMMTFLCCASLNKRTRLWNGFGLLPLDLLRYLSYMLFK
jgi:Ran GTPase-activating protein (RanGAP) involved in mRNA processing and transport